MKWLKIQEKLARQSPVFSSAEFRRSAGLTPFSAKMLLIRYARKGLIQKLKDNRGLYALRGRQPHPWLLANKLWQPSYVSLETALAHYGLMPETVYAVSSVTTRTTKSFKSMGTLFTYQKIKTVAFQGYRPRSVDGQTVLIAEREKAVADILYFVHLGKKTWNDRFRWASVNRKKVLHYLACFERPSLMIWAHHVIPR